MKKKNSYIILLILLQSVFAFCQQLPNITPPSPEASAVFKFTEVPVSLYTGLPNIEIPLFEIKSGGVTIPVSISYHSRGIQVDEISSRVGLGWALDCGGMISKQVRDKDDELSFSSCIDYNTFFSDLSSRQSTNQWQLSESCDMIPDQYSFSVNGMSGKFLRGTQEGLLLQNYSNVKINENEITDGNGNKYFFGENNATDGDVTLSSYTVRGVNNIHSHTESSTYSINTWHLTKIETASGALINFDYKPETTYYYKRSYDKLYGSLPDVESYASYINSTQQRINTIMFDQGELDFVYFDTPREDLAGSYCLKKIVLKDTYGQIIKQAIFDYEYTTSSDQNMNYFLSNDGFAKKRLFLKSVQILDKDNNALPPYLFEYNSTVLPSRHSNSVDVWGYYNGKNNGPYLQTFISDRTVDPDKMQAGLLKGMTKPEGGKINFYYEPNKGVNIFPESDVLIENPNPSNHRSIVLSSLSANATENNIDVETGLPYYQQNGKYEDVFIVSDDYQTGSSYYNSSGPAVESTNCPCYQTCTNDSNTECMFTRIIEKWNTTTNHYEYYSTLYTGQNRIISFVPGKYKLKVKYVGTHQPYDTIDPNMFFWIYVSWDEEMTNHVPVALACENTGLIGTKVVFAAGNRIRKIEYKNADDSTALIKTYGYTNPNNGNTSGRVLGLTNFIGIITIGDLNGLDYKELQFYGSGAGSPFSTYQGNTIGYEYVTEYYGEENNTIGKTEYRYTILQDTGDFYKYPYHPPTDNEWLRGKELKITHFKKIGNDYQMVQNKENTYLLADEIEYTGNEALCNLPFFKPSVKTPTFQNFEPSNGGRTKNARFYTIPLVVTPITINNLDNGYLTYYMTGGTMDLKRTKTTDYFDGGNEMVTTKEYSYRYNNHYNISSTIETTSVGEPISNQYYYANDPEMSGKPFVLQLKGKNMVDVPLQTETIHNNEIIAIQENDYANWGNGLLMPEIIKTSKGTGDLEPRVRYIKYDEFGHPLELQQENGTTVCYIWGYHSSQPIAKIENQKYDSIAADLIVEAQSASDSNNEGQLLIRLQDIRGALPDAMVTTYTYKPLVGVSTITDARGQTTYYDYDSFGRLSIVRDAAGNPLSKNNYHYRTQN